MPDIPAPLRRMVMERARNRCEYCTLSQAGQEAAFHVDHVRPVLANGPTHENNLALACVSCSLRKGAREAIPDPATGQDMPIYNPRRQRWDEHFRWDGVRLVGTTATGRATVAALALNRPIILAIRAEEAVFDRHPPR